MTDLFGAPPPAKPKKAPRASKTVQAFSAGAVRSEPMADALIAAKREPVMTPGEYERSWDLVRDGIVDGKGADFAQAHWNTEVHLRAAIGVELRQARMMKAALDGRCNRIKAGVIPHGSD